MTNIQTVAIKPDNQSLNDTTKHGLARKTGLLYAILAFIVLDFSKVRQFFGAEIREIEDGLSSLG